MESQTHHGLVQRVDISDVPGGNSHLEGTFAMLLSLVRDRNSKKQTVLEV